MQPHFSVILNKALQDKALSAEEGYTLINCADEDVPAVLTAAGSFVIVIREGRLPIRARCSSRLPIYAVTVARTARFAKTRVILMRGL